MKRLSQKHQPGSHIGFMFDPINHTSRHAQLPHTPHVGHSIANCRKSFTNTLSHPLFVSIDFEKRENKGGENAGKIGFSSVWLSEEIGEKT